MEFDNRHHEVAERLIASLGLTSIPSSMEDDFNSVADRFINSVVPMGMKRRGNNSGIDFNLTAWSAATGLLPEFANCGNKLYLYWTQKCHILLRFRDQELMNTLLPYNWTKIYDDRDFKWVERPYSLVRKSSEASNVQQGVVFVPYDEKYFDIMGVWNLNEGLEFCDQDWLKSL